MHLTVAVCTHNRAALVGQLLGTMRQLRVPHGCTWELLVVANACTDDTARVVRECARELPLIMLEEPIPGVSHARNRAVGAASGSYILWTDDDALVDRDWLSAYVEAFRAHPEAAFFGGPIEPVLEPGTPRWLSAILPEIEDVFAARKLGDTEFKFRAPILPWGVNFAVMTSRQKEHAFDTRLGHRGKHVIVGEETNMLCAMLAAGDTGWWVPGARVQHFIPLHRQRLSHLGAYWHAQGVHAASNLPASRGPVLWGYPWWLVRSCAFHQSRYWVRRMTVKKTEWIRDYAGARMTLGALTASRRSRKRGVSC